MLIVLVYYATFDDKRYRAAAAAYGGKAPPEARLLPAVVGSVLFPAGMFVFALTNRPEIHWIVSTLASIVFSIGHGLIALGLINFMIDSYVIYAASVCEYFFLRP